MESKEIPYGYYQCGCGGETNIAPQIHPRPQTISGHTRRISCGCGKLYLTENSSNSYQEVFTKLGKSGGCAASFLDGIGRLITFALNAGVPKDTIIRAFMGIQCPSPMWSDGVQVLSCLDGIAKLLEEKENE